MSKIGIIGDGNVGSALARGFERAGHDVRAVGKDPGAIRDTAGWGEVIILAVPFGALDDVVKTVGEGMRGKTVVDVTNALDADRNLAVGFTTSGAEELQKKLPKSRVVKAFHTVFAQHMDTQLGDQQTPHVRRRDAAAPRRRARTRPDTARPIDAGPLKNARLLEPLATSHQWAMRSDGH